MKYQLFQVEHSTGVATLAGEADNINDLVSLADKVAYTDNYTWDDVYKLYPLQIYAPRKDEISRRKNKRSCFYRMRCYNDFGRKTLIKRQLH